MLNTLKHYSLPFHFSVYIILKLRDYLKYNNNFCKNLINKCKISLRSWNIKNGK